MRPLAVPALALGLIFVVAPAFGAASEFTRLAAEDAKKKAGAADPADPQEATAPAQGADASGGPGGDERRGGPTNLGGYSYHDGQRATSGSNGGSARRPRYRKTGPVVSLPGFEQLPDGSSHLFVELTQSVPVEERKGQGTVTYVLKGASPRVWNNTNELVTVHFNTPVSRARLVPRGSDLHFVVDLRAATAMTWKMDEGTDKATLTIEFPKGDYLAPPASDPPPAPGAEGAPVVEGGKPATPHEKPPTATPKRFTNAPPPDFKKPSRPRLPSQVRAAPGRSGAKP